MRTTTLLAALIVLSTACGTNVEYVSRPAPADAADAGTAVLADQVAIDEIAVYQSVKVTIAVDGALSKPNAPLIAGRPALVRAHARSADRKSRKLAAELRVTRAGKADLVLRTTPTPLPATVSDGDLDSTFNFKIEAGDLTTDAAISVRVAESYDAPDAVTFPADGKGIALGAKDGSGTLRVKFVPVQYDQDGSGRTPPLTNVAVYRDALYNLYPTAKIEISVREPLPWSQVIGGSGQGWDSLLDAIIETRASDRAPDDLYYVGVFTPKATLAEFCEQTSCVLGVAPASQLEEVGLRVAMITGYSGSFAGGTLAQELAHAMGREHAPCGRPDGPDPDYPYPKGSTGVWGYNLLKDQLVDPETYRDFLGYCEPVWVSDYTFAGLYERMVQVAQTKTAPSRRSAMKTFHLAADGTLTHGPTIDVLAVPVGGGAVTVSYANGAGHLLSTARGHVRSTDRLNGSTYVLVEGQAPAGATEVRIGSSRPLTLRSPLVRH